jgi:hypothetical protein
LEGELALMPTPEEMLIQKIADMEVEQELARVKVSQLKLEVCKADSVFIECSIKKERLIEELRMFRLRAVDKELSHVEKDTERLKLIMPELLKRL